MAEVPEELREQYRRCMRRIESSNKRKPKSKRVSPQKACYEEVVRKKKKPKDYDYEVADRIIMLDGYACDVEE